MEELNMWDVHKEEYDMENRKIINTFTNKTTGKGSRIDYIWVTENIFNEIIIAKIKDFSDIKTDHRMLLIGFTENLITPKMPFKKSINKRIIYEYSNTEEKEKESFDNELIDCASFWDKNWSIEEKWEFYERSIRESGRTLLRKKWRQYQWHFRKLLKKLNIEENYYFSENMFLRKILIYKYIKELNEVYDIIFLKLSYESAKVKEEKIKEAVERRCEDLHSNQRRMIDSVMEKEIKKIVIDRLLTEDKDGQDILVTDEAEINKLTIEHFKNFAGIQNHDVELPDFWKNEYESKSNVEENIYQNVLDPINDEEWVELIKALPLHKASGPTTMTYEDIKYAPKEFNELFRNLIDDVFRTQEMPNDWKIANIYPIPKPKLWGHRLVNTRPITLLEVTRKTMMKILTKRLSKVIKEKRVLQGYQYAGLPLNSTFEPLRIINEVINHANERNKELWLLALDMSKAYDRINISMLEKAMERIKFPKKLQKILTSLFLGRKNRVFTQSGLTELYDMQCDLGYQIDGKQIINHYENIERPLAFNFPGLSYMDDMNFISDCKDNLEKILEIADSFYRMNDIKINKEKSELLLRTKDRKIDLNEQKEINIRFGNSKIDIIPAERKGSIRILGVWFNAFNQKNHVLVKMKEEIKNFYQSLLLKKRLTDKQMVYIFNMLIVPRVKYCTQLIVLTEKECDELIVPFRKMFKNKLGLAITAPNAIVHMKEIYNVKSFHDNQLQAKITNFVIQINDENELGKIMEIRLFNLQEMLMLTKNPLKELSFDDIVRFKKIFPTLFRNIFLLENISLAKKHNFDFKVESVINNMEVKGGNLTIKEVLKKDTYFNNFKLIKKLNIIFLDQILTLDGRREEIFPITTNPLSDKFVGTFDKIEQKVLYGKVFKLDKEEAIILHHTTVNDPEDFNIVFKKCEGCILDDDTLTKNRIKNICIFGAVPEKVYFLENQKRSMKRVLTKNKSAIIPDISQHHFDIKIRYEEFFRNNPDRYLADDIRTDEMRGCSMSSVKNIIEKIILKEKFNNNLSVEKLMNINDKIIKQDKKRVHIYVDGSVVNSEQLRNANLGVSQKALKEMIISSYFNLAHVNIKGFFKLCYANSGTENIAGISGVCVYDENHLILDEIYVSVENWITPAKTETLAFLIALIVCHRCDNVIIYTDCESVYNRYNILCQTNDFTNARKIFKEQSNIYLWALIRIIIKENFSFFPTIIKVKAHADNVYHNELDKRIKERFNDLNSTYLINLKYEELSQIKYSIMCNNVNIETQLRRFIRHYTETINLEKFIFLNRNVKYDKLSIDWAVTFEYLKEKEKALTTSFWTSKKRRKKIQRIIEEIPTIEQCKKSNFDIYKNWKCVRCGRKRETFHHVWLCNSENKKMKKIIKDAFDLMVNEIKSIDKYTLDEGNFYDYVWNETFSKLFYSKTQFTFIDIIKGIFPLGLTEYLTLKVKMNLKDRNTISVLFLDFIYDETKLIWYERCNRQIEKEKKLRINRKRKFMRNKSINGRLEDRRLPIRNPKIKAEGLLRGIYFNQKTLDFIIHVILIISY
ncbi:hypothetical protein GLOIN_2v1480544 [Rhizophagus irregularis DAOM 181602=DAOM 197198]|nr:hypothetical protein GLOIN_2v1480544 [Rhizophagus irregularis DAOM 181602=DAOM 197198]